MKVLTGYPLWLGDKACAKKGQVKDQADHWYLTTDQGRLDGGVTVWGYPWLSLYYGCEVPKMNTLMTGARLGGAKVDSEQITRWQVVTRDRTGGMSSKWILNKPWQQWISKWFCRRHRFHQPKASMKLQVRWGMWTAQWRRKLGPKE